MPRNSNRDRKKTTKPEKPRRGKKRYCQFCADQREYVDYKDIAQLRKYMSERGKIRARRVTGNCARHQRLVAIAVKNAREMALLPYVTISTGSGRPGRS